MKMNQLEFNCQYLDFNLRTLTDLDLWMDWTSLYKPRCIDLADVDRADDFACLTLGLNCL